MMRQGTRSFVYGRPQALLVGAEGGRVGGEHFDGAGSGSRCQREEAEQDTRNMIARMIGQIK
jgi:hypothetical protein